MAKPEEITYGDDQLLKPKQMGFLERFKTGTLLSVIGLFTEIASYPNQFLVDTVNTKAWLYSYFPREGVIRLLNFMKAYAPRVRSTREIQIRRDLEGRSCESLSWNDMRRREEPRFTILSSSGRILKSLFPRYIVTPPTP